MEVNPIESKESHSKFDDLDSQIEHILLSDGQTELYTRIEGSSVEEVNEYIADKYPERERVEINHLELENIKDSYLLELNNIEALHNGCPEDAKNIPLYFISSKLKTLYLIPLIDEDTGDIRIGGRTMDNAAILVKTIHRILQMRLLVISGLGDEQ